MYSDKSCKPCEGGVAPLDTSQATSMLEKLPGWQADPGAKKIMRTFEFKGYYKTIAFVNAIAWMAHKENHHPDLEVSFNTCKVIYTTHAINGLSENDFICAAKVDNIHKSGPV